MLYQHYMATEDVTLAQFKAELGALKTAIEGGSFNDARVKLALARVTLAGLFDSQSVDNRSYAMRHEKVLEDLESAIDLAERAANGGGKTQIVPVQFGRIGW